MSQSREEILANFQECTGIENVEEAIYWLESAHWDLLAAINSAVPQDEQMRMFGDSRNENNAAIPAAVPVSAVPVSVSRDFAEPATDSERTIIIYVHFHGNMYKLKVPESLNVGCVKTMAFVETKVPVCQQVLSGWPNSAGPSDETTLKSLKLPESIHLYLITRGLQPGGSSASSDMEVEVESEKKEFMLQPEAGDQLSRPSSSRGLKSRKPPKNHALSNNSDDVISLKIHDGNKNKEHNIVVSKTMTISDIKKDAENLTGIPVAKQTWLGWPDNSDDSTKLSEIDLDRPFDLTVVSLDESSNSTHTKSKRRLVRYSPSPNPSDSGADTDSFEDASESFSAEDEMFTEDTPVVTNRIAPLMPDNVDDETIGSVSFIDGYTLRYGQNSPNFFSGPLENAVNEAFLKTGREKKMLAIYLHHDGSILSNVFCSELLGSDAILPIFNTYFVVWGWDVTNRRNREMLLDSVATHLGHSVVQEITAIKTDDFPALLIVSRIRSNVELLNVIRGNIGSQELLGLLLNNIDVFSERVEAEIQNEEERAARDRIKFEQDMAYQESLQLDKAKEESRKQQLLLQTQEEERLRREEEQRNEERIAVESKLPIEPPEETPPKEIFTFRFRTPTGDFFIRRFNPSDKLQSVFDYLLVKGFRINEFKVISAFPRKDLTALEGTAPLKDVGLCSQETLTLEER